jgi:hypothetical protein
MLHTKLDVAKLKLLDVQKAERPRGGGSESHRDLVMQLVRSARGVYPLAKTFGKDWLPGNRFKVWRDTWEDRLTDAELRNHTLGPTPPAEGTSRRMTPERARMAL